MSGALLEVSDGSRVRVIHTSVLEYFQSLRSQQHQDASSTGPLADLKDLLNTRDDEKELYFMRCCLTYLTTSPRPGPLSGDPDVVSEAEVIRRRHPFLEYAAANWHMHAAFFLDFAVSRPVFSGGVTNHDLFHGFISDVQDFIESKRHLARWIETSYLFRSEPKLTVLLRSLQYALKFIGTCNIRNLVSRQQTTVQYCTFPDPGEPDGSSARGMAGTS